MVPVINKQFSKYANVWYITVFTPTFFYRGTQQETTNDNAYFFYKGFLIF